LLDSLWRYDEHDTALAHATPVVEEWGDGSDLHCGFDGKKRDARSPAIVDLEGRLTWSTIMSIRFAVRECWLGTVLVAATDKGICAILLGDDPITVVRDLHERFPDAQASGHDEPFERMVAAAVRFVEAPGHGLDVPLDLHGTSFRQRVWQALREIPAGSTASYSDIAAHIGAPHAAYLVAEACAANPVAVAVPCHRIVRKDGTLAGYRWGFKRKRALLARESAWRAAS
jgi:AraC family transcriptional regulator, regulatory protein of adaptative response / methylated-DNA-[protein]-cysteine methyltransferase